MFYVFFFFFKQKTAYEIMPSLVGSEMCIRDSLAPVPHDRGTEWQHPVAAEVVERRHELAVCEIAGDAEDDEAARIRVAFAAERRGRRIEASHAADAQLLVVAEAVGDLVADALLGGIILGAHFFSCTAWPPNSLRSAASTLPLNVSA